MKEETRKMIEAIASTDSTIDKKKLDEGLRIIAGEVPALSDNEFDRPVSRNEAARLLGVCPQTVTLYARRGLIRPIRIGEKKERASGYSMQSIREALR